MALGIKIFQVVGYQNSGKTTLVESLVKQLTIEGYKVGTIKHHGHGSEPTINDNTKDTGKHRESGAVATCVEGNGMINIIAKKSEWELDDLISIYRILKLDIVIVEGYKMQEYPKVVLLRNKQDELLLNQLSNVKCIISWYDLNETHSSLPVFHIEEKDLYMNMLTSNIKGEDM